MPHTPSALGQVIGQPISHHCAPGSVLGLSIGQMYKSLSVTCRRSVVFSGYSELLLQWDWHFIIRITPSIWPWRHHLHMTYCQMSWFIVAVVTFTCVFFSLTPQTLVYCRRGNLYVLCVFQRVFQRLIPRLWFMVAMVTFTCCVFFSS